MSQVEIPWEVSLGLLLPKSEPEKGPIACMAQPEMVTEVSGCRVLAACGLPTFPCHPVKAGCERGRWVLPPKMAVWRTCFRRWM